MSGEATTVARPYAEAVFSRALETDKLDLWADMLELMSAVVSDPELAGMIVDRRLSREQMTDLLLEIGGGRLSDEGQNLLRLLVENDRLQVLPQIQTLYTEMKSGQEGVIEVDVTSAYDLKPAQEEHLAQALAKELGREVRITSHIDETLIGGVRIQAGDMVIDGSVAGQLSQLANELGI